MLDGVVPFPPDFAARYRRKGYWGDRSIASVFGDVFSEPIGNVVDFIGRYRWQLTGISVFLVAYQLWKGRSPGGNA